MKRPKFVEVDSATIAAEVEMLRAEANKAILIVEGADDSRLFSKFADEASCDLVIAHGRDNAIGAMELIAHRQLIGVVCIVDADYDEFLNIVSGGEDIIVTDEHDLETMMIRSRALASVLREMLSRPKWQRFAEAGGTVEDLILRIAHPIGVLRLYSLESKSNLKFTDLDYKFIRKSDMMSDLSTMVRIIYNNSQRPNCPTINGAIEYIVAWANRDHDRWRMCSGHDLSAILGRALQGFLGNHNSREASPEAIESRLRLAYDAEAFTGTELFMRLRRWEARSLGYRVLRGDLRAPE